MFLLTNQILNCAKTMISLKKFVLRIAGEDGNVQWSWCEKWKVKMVILWDDPVSRVKSEVDHTDYQSYWPQSLSALVRILIQSPINRQRQPARVVGLQEGNWKEKGEKKQEHLLHGIRTMSNVEYLPQELMRKMNPLLRPNWT